MKNIIEKALQYEFKNKQYNTSVLKVKLEHLLKVSVEDIIHIATTDYKILETTFTLNNQKYVLWFYTLKLYESESYFITDMELEYLDD
jgi:hypothetical protein